MRVVCENLRPEADAVGFRIREISLIDLKANRRKRFCGARFGEIIPETHRVFLCLKSQAILGTKRLGASLG